MKYRTFPKTDDQFSLLGFGTLRLPVNQTDKAYDVNLADINETEAIKIIRTAIDKGVNYVDTAYNYHGETAEIVLGKALKDGYREKVHLADKMPTWLIREEDDLEKVFNTQLERLGVDYVDMYLVHNLNAINWERKVLKHNIFDFMEKKKAEGKIKYIGFSFHDEFDVFKKIIDTYPWDFCQIQLNYMDVDFQAGVKGLKYAGSKDIPVVVMEPLKGGKLTDILPPSIEAFWSKAPIKRTPAEWGLKWVADFPEVLTILSGMTTIEQVEENIRILSETEPNSLTETEHEIIKTVADEYEKLIKYSCTGCKYCLPCSVKIDIPTVIGLYNNWLIYKNSRVLGDYDMFVSPKRGPSTCIECKECEERCPQNLPISDIMKLAAEFFEPEEKN